MRLVACMYIPIESANDFINLELTKVNELAVLCIIFAQLCEHVFVKH